MRTEYCTPERTKVIQTDYTEEDKHTYKLHWFAGEQEVMEDGGKLMGRRQATEGLKRTVMVGSDSGSSGLPERIRRSRRGHRKEAEAGSGLTAIRS